MNTSTIKQLVKSFEMSGVKCFNGSTEYILHNGYKIVVPSYMPHGIFVTTEQDRTRVRENIFSLKVCDVIVSRGDKDLYLEIFEKDIVKFQGTSGKEYTGIVTYSDTNFAWGIIEASSGKFCLLCKAKITDVLGNLNSNPKILDNLGYNPTEEDPSAVTAKASITAAIEESSHSTSLTSSEAKVRTSERKESVKVNYPEDGGYAYLNEPIPGIDDRKSKKQAPSVSTSQNNSAKVTMPSNVPSSKCPCEVYVSVVRGKTGLGYEITLRSHSSGKEKHFIEKFKNQDMPMSRCILGSVIIALSKLKNPSSVILFTPYDLLNQIINNKRIDVWAKNDWRTEDNNPVMNKEDYKNLKAVMERLSCDITATLYEN